MDIKRFKADLRKNVLLKKSGVSAESNEIANMSIKASLLSLTQYQKSETLFCFVGRSDEIDTIPLILNAISQNKRVCVPKCISRGIMQAYAINSPGDLHLGKFGIREPNDYCRFISPSEIDFAIVPCVSCDKHGNRLGYGGGYYDRYLSRQSFPTAAVCYEELLLDNMPTEKHDVPVDFVVTDCGVYSCLGISYD